MSRREYEELVQALEAKRKVSVDKVELDMEQFEMALEGLRKLEQALDNRPSLIKKLNEKITGLEAELALLRGQTRVSELERKVQRLEAELKQSYSTKNYAVKTGLLDLEKKYATYIRSSPDLAELWDEIMQLTVEERDRGTDASGRMQRCTPSSLSAVMHGHSRNASVMSLPVTGGDSGGASVAGAECEDGDSGVGGGSAFASQSANDPEAWGLASLTTVATSASGHLSSHGSVVVHDDPLMGSGKYVQTQVSRLKDASLPSQPAPHTPHYATALGFVGPLGAVGGGMPTIDEASQPHLDALQRVYAAGDVPMLPGQASAAAAAMQRPASLFQPAGAGGEGGLEAASLHAAHDTLVASMASLRALFAGMMHCPPGHAASSSTPDSSAQLTAGPRVPDASALQHFEALAAHLQVSVEQLRMQYSQLSQQGSSAISSGVGGSAGGIHVQMQADASYFQAQAEAALASLAALRSHWASIAASANAVQSHTDLSDLSTSSGPIPGQSMSAFLLATAAEAQAHEDTLMASISSLMHALQRAAHERADAEAAGRSHSQTLLDAGSAGSPCVSEAISIGARVTAADADADAAASLSCQPMDSLASPVRTSGANANYYFHRASTETAGSVTDVASMASSNFHMPMPPAPTKTPMAGQSAPAYSTRGRPFGCGHSTQDQPMNEAAVAPLVAVFSSFLSHLAGQGKLRDAAIGRAGSPAGLEDDADSAMQGAASTAQGGVFAGMSMDAVVLLYGEYVRTAEIAPAALASLQPGGEEGRQVPAADAAPLPLLRFSILVDEDSTERNPSWEAALAAGVSASAGMHMQGAPAPFPFADCTAAGSMQMQYGVGAATATGSGSTSMAAASSCTSANATCSSNPAQLPLQALEERHANSLRASPAAQSLWRDLQVMLGVQPPFSASHGNAEMLPTRVTVSDWALDGTHASEDGNGDGSVDGSTSQAPRALVTPPQRGDSADAEDFTLSVVGGIGALPGVVSPAEAPAGEEQTVSAATTKLSGATAGAASTSSRAQHAGSEEVQTSGTAATWVPGTAAVAAAVLAGAASSTIPDSATTPSSHLMVQSPAPTCAAALTATPSGMLASTAGDAQTAQVSVEAVVGRSSSSGHSLGGSPRSPDQATVSRESSPDGTSDGTLRQSPDSDSHEEAMAELLILRNLKSTLAEQLTTSQDALAALNTQLKAALEREDEAASLAERLTIKASGLEASHAAAEAEAEEFMHQLVATKVQLAELQGEYMQVYQALKKALANEKGMQARIDELERVVAVAGHSFAELDAPVSSAISSAASASGRTGLRSSTPGVTTSAGSIGSMHTQPGTGQGNGSSTAKPLPGLEGSAADQTGTASSTAFLSLEGATAADAAVGVESVPASTVTGAGSVVVAATPERTAGQGSVSRADSKGGQSEWDEVAKAAIKAASAERLQRRRQQSAGAAGDTAVLGINYAGLHDEEEEPLPDELPTLASAWAEVEGQGPATHEAKH